MKIASLKIASLACAILPGALASAVPFADAARAQPGCIYRDAALRGGPGSGEYLIGVIPAQSPVVVVRRGEKWSLVSYDGESGYVATRHLSRKARDAGDPPAWIESQNAGRVLLREIDPYFADGRLGGGPGRRAIGVGDATYFTGFRRSAWTDRDRAPAAAASAPRAPCALASAEGERK